MTLNRSLITPAEALLVSGIGRGTLTRALADGTLPSRKIKGRRRILVEDFERFLGLPVITKINAA